MAAAEDEDVSGPKLVRPDLDSTDRRIGVLSRRINALQQRIDFDKVHGRPTQRREQSIRHLAETLRLAEEHRARILNAIESDQG